MKILNVNMSLDPVTGGGTSERTFQISRHLVKAGIPCSVLTTDFGLQKEQIKHIDGANVIALPCLFNRFYIPKCSLWFLINVIERFDVVHLMNHWTVINALVYRACKYLNKPYVVCPAGALPLYGRSKNIKRLYNWIIGKSIISRADGHVAIAATEIFQFQAYGVDPKIVSIIPNGVNAEDFQADDIADFRRKYRLGDNPFILFVGRLNPIKGPDLLLQAFYILKDQKPSHHLVFAGPDGGMLKELENITNSFNIGERVHFLGYLGGADKSQAYHAADLLVIPSRQEAMSIVVLEAGVTGTPVLMTDQCGFDQIGEIGGGMVVKPTAKDLQEGIVTLLENPANLHKTGERLKKHILMNYTWESVIDKYISLYRKLFQDKN